MYSQAQEEQDFMVSSISEFAQSEAHFLGGRWPDREWLLTDQDFWIRNPHYTGKPGRHPEDDHYDEEVGEPAVWADDDGGPF